VEKIKVALKKINESVKLVEVEDTLTAYQELVGGYIEVVYLENDFILICNEEGKLEGLPMNFPLGRDIIVGDVFFSKDDGEGGFASMTDFDLAYLKQCIKL
jgi:hypothetical protein